MPLGTPFHPRTAPLCVSQNWRIWSGYYIASSYEVLHDYEYHAIRNTAALIDVSPLYKYELSGKDSETLLNRILTRDIGRCAVGQAMYTCLLNDEGKVIQDGTVFRLDERHYQLNLADPSYRWLKLNSAGLDVQIEDVSEDAAVLAVQGPLAREILKQVTDADLERLRFFRLTFATLGDVRGLISRTGYTGDLGYEVWVPASYAVKLWDLITKAGKNFGVTPAGMLALDMARIEAGFILIEVDYTSAEKALIPAQKYSPFEIGLGWTVDLKKEHFIGKKALLKEQQDGVRRQTVGLEIDWDDFERVFLEKGLAPQVPTQAWRGSAPIYRDHRQVGRATSGTWSPAVKRYIAIATIDTEVAGLGSRLSMEITVEHERKRVGATVVKTPFFDPPRKRA
ncbi:MAG TPA: aminomethyltransferase family protein [Candidatus Acidoferrales bacterium]|nr:aminomethyltransferase family protein [Candidatus Acidoferrales bacterium]